MRPILIAFLALVINVASATAQDAPEKPQSTTRVAVVNIGVILDKYEKAREIKGDLKDLLREEADPKKRWSKIFVDRTANMSAEEGERTQKFWGDYYAALRRYHDMLDQIDWVAYYKNHPDAQEQFLEARKAFANAQKVLDRDRPREPSKESSRKIIAVWLDIRAAIETQTAKQKIVVVLGYSDAADKNKLDLFPSINRKMGAMDIGGTVPLFAAPHTDITQAVLDLLNGKREKEAKAAAMGTDRVAVVNVGHVFHRYKKAFTFKSDLEAKARPYNEKAKQLQDEMVSWDQAMRNRPRNPDAMEELQAKIRKNKRALEDLADDMRLKLGTKSQDNLVVLWKDVQDGVKNYATRHGIELVLGYGDPVEKAALDDFPNVNRKKQAMESGFAMPLFAPAYTDVTDGVVLLLNDPDAAPEPAQKKMLACKIGAINIDHVFKEYTVARQFQKKLDELRAPVEKEAAKIERDIKAWDSAIKAEDFENTSKADYELRIRKGKRDLEDLEYDLQKAVAKMQKGGLVSIWREFQDCNSRVSEAYGFGPLLGFAGPMDQKTLDLAGVKRTMQAMDSGAASVLFVSPEVELSGAVTAVLNKWGEFRKESSPQKDAR